MAGSAGANDFPLPSLLSYLTIAESVTPSSRGLFGRLRDSSYFIAVMIRHEQFAMSIGERD